MDAESERTEYLLSQVEARETKLRILEALITELCDALECYKLLWDEHPKLVQRAREAVK